MEPGADVGEDVEKDGEKVVVERKRGSAIKAVTLTTMEHI
jgi:hypothetical protein